MTRREWLTLATGELRDAGIDSARLDAELLLAHALGITRTGLHARPDEPLPEHSGSVLEAMLGLRVIRVPLAYIVGHRDFYGRLFKVTPSVLIPRPETEDIIEIMKALPAPRAVIDVGTGSGALAVTLALEFPNTRVTATDISRRALSVAASNAASYRTDIAFVQSDLLADVPVTAGPTTIVANLPYVALADRRSPETGYEPEEALFAADEGLELITRLISQAAGRLTSGDYLLLESNPAQQPAIVTQAQENGFAEVQTRRLITVLRKI